MYLEELDLQYLINSVRSVCGKPIFILNLLQYFLRYISLLRRAERSSGNHMHEEKSESYQNKQGENPCKETFDYVLYHTRTYLMY